MSATIAARGTAITRQAGSPATVGSLGVAVWTDAKAFVARLRRGDHVGLFFLAALGMLLLSPRILLRTFEMVAEFATQTEVRVDWAAWPQVPVLVPIGVITALATFGRTRAVRGVALLTALTLVVTVFGPLTPTAAIPLLLFGFVTWALIRLPLPRLTVALLVTLVTVASLAGTLRWLEDDAVVGVLAGFPIVLPLLWYSVYEHGRDGPLPLRRYLLYIGSRLVGSPVTTYRDLFVWADDARLMAVRWAGVRAIYIGLLAGMADHLIGRMTISSNTASLTGMPLLAVSYLEYLGYCLGFVERFNYFIGVLRLFGVPVRSNFNYWMLARTPNEHWQRWNLLAREWFLTFVFYPIMRARRWLFVAVMGALLGAGILHVLPVFMTQGMGLPEFTARAAYWLINGVAIYLVIKIPGRYPGMVDRLGMRDSLAWSIVGIVLTSAFYALLHGLRVTSDSWAEMANYLARIVGVAV